MGFLGMQEAFTFHLPVPARFDRRTVLPAEQMRSLRETAAKNRYRRQQLKIRRDEQKFVVGGIIDLIVRRAADDFFNTPVPTEIPTDSFAADYELEDMVKIEDDLQLTDIDKINNLAKKVCISGDNDSPREERRASKKRRKSGSGSKLRKSRQRQSQGSSMLTLKKKTNEIVEQLT